MTKVIILSQHLSSKHLYDFWHFIRTSVWQRWQSQAMVEQCHNKCIPRSGTVHHRPVFEIQSEWSRSLYERKIDAEWEHCRQWRTQASISCMFKIPQLLTKFRERKKKTKIDHLQAYRKWVNVHGTDDNLPGLDLNHDQLFFLNYAQIWCGSMRPEDALSKLRSSVHSPGAIRVLGPLSNSKEFAEAYGCPIGSPMNPSNKCNVW